MSSGAGNVITALSLGMSGNCGQHSIYKWSERVT